jgi:hypothetical protein
MKPILKALGLTLIFMLDLVLFLLLYISIDGRHIRLPVGSNEYAYVHSMFILISIGLIIVVNLPLVILYFKKKNRPPSTEDTESKSILSIYIKTETEQAFIYKYNTNLQNWSFAVIVFIVAFFRGFFMVVCGFFVVNVLFNFSRMF